MAFEALGYTLMGAQNYAFDCHYAMYDSQLVHSILIRAGFREIQIAAVGRKNGDCLETEIITLK